MLLRSRYIEKIKAFVDVPIIKVVTGIRRCGKSTFLKMIAQDFVSKGIDTQNMLLINKDSFEFDDMVNYKQLVQYVKTHFKGISGKKYLFIDEVQEIDGWEKALSGFLTDHVADLYVTGSNSNMLSSELATYISGRYIEIHMQPLVFSEYLQFREAKCQQISVETEFYSYLKYGGFPGIHSMEYNDEVVYQYLQAILSTVVLKDVVARNSIRDVALLERVVRYIADVCGSITSTKRIADFLKSQKLAGSVDTVHSYLAMLCSAYIFAKANRFDIKGKRILEINEKYYLTDLGLKNCLLGYRVKDISGHLENIVYNELIYRGYNVSIGKLDQLEIDFVATRNEQIVYIQVSYLMIEPSTIEREYAPLAKIKDNHPKMVLSLDKMFDSNRDGILWMNLIDFLLNNNSIK